jgi:hypothetical protein
VFLWDCIDVEKTLGPSGREVCDPWIALAAIAVRTQHFRLGPMMTPLSRRRPWKVARETVTLDHLSRGRLILAVGLGFIGDGGYAKVGEPLDPKIRAKILDEALAIVDGLWSGQPFRFQGVHYHLEEMTFLPRPVQRPRIPIWVVGIWPYRKSMNRVLAWDGVIPARQGEDGSFFAKMSSADLQAMRAFFSNHRTRKTPFDIVVEGETPGSDLEQARSIVRPLVEAGVTWWLEAVYGTPETQGGIEGMRARIRQGPPRL